MVYIVLCCECRAQNQQRHGLSFEFPPLSRPSRGRKGRDNVYCFHKLFGVVQDAHEVASCSFAVFTGWACHGRFASLVHCLPYAVFGTIEDCRHGFCLLMT